MAGGERAATRVAIISIRGTIKAPREIGQTLAMLNLRHQNHCVVQENKATLYGMLRKVKDYITWGEVREEVFQELLEKRGKEFQGRLKDRLGKYIHPVLTVGEKKYQPYFRLNPPRKGFGRKGIKVSFPAGGALGYRGEKINDLIKRML